jgi:hypothetical protein
VAGDRQWFRGRNVIELDMPQAQDFAFNPDFVLTRATRFPIRHFDR